MEPANVILSIKARTTRENNWCLRSVDGVSSTAEWRTQYLTYRLLMLVWRRKTKKKKKTHLLLYLTYLFRSAAPGLLALKSLKLALDIAVGRDLTF